MAETNARLSMQGAMELANEVAQDTDGWIVAEVTFVGMRAGEARYKLRASHGTEMIETDSYVPWMLLKRHAPRLTKAVDVTQIPNEDSIFTLP